ncbi:hypothetical protein KFE25_001712 [Diacronema lutheri]|uniref:Uncharacterized protein n=1 Tax=Diacronema lutheri TaxID=2081491 RepID=A0A8J6C7N3_DIALT|nr:hypothetical protein KFE25_001712 [Diacronema lutheri]
MRLLLVALIVGGSAAFVPLGAIRCRGRGFAGTAPDCGLSQTTVVGHTPLPLHAARARLPLHVARARPRMLFNTPSRLGADIVLAIANWFGQWSIRMAPRALADAVLLTGKGLSDAVLLTGRWLTIMCVACVFVTTKLNGDERKRMRALEERKLAFDEEERQRKLALEERKLAFDEEERKRKLDLEERKFALDEEERKRKLAQPFTLKLWS